MGGGAASFVAVHDHQPSSMARGANLFGPESLCPRPQIAPRRGGPEEARGGRVSERASHKGIDLTPFSLRFALEDGAEPTISLKGGFHAATAQEDVEIILQYLSRKRFRQKNRLFRTKRHDRRRCFFAWLSRLNAR